MEKKLIHEFIYQVVFYLVITSIIFLAFAFAIYRSRELFVTITLLVLGIIFALIALYKLLIYTIMNKTFKETYLHYETDIKELIVNFQNKKQKHKILYDKIIKIILIVIPFVIASSILFGILFENVFFAYVFPGISISLLMVYAISMNIYFSFNGYEDEYYLTKKKNVIIGKNMMFIFGKKYLYNFFKLGVIYEEELFYYTIFKHKIFKIKINLKQFEILEIIKFIGDL